MTYSELSREDLRCLSAAVGWLELGNYIEANEELENITALARAHPDVLEVRYDIYAHAQRWDGACEIATTLTLLRPEKNRSWHRLAKATRMSKGVKAAHDVLLHTHERMPRDLEIIYQLACHAAALGNMENCILWLNKALDACPSRKDADQLKLRALGEADLETFWTQTTQSA